MRCLRTMSRHLRFLRAREAALRPQTSLYTSKCGDEMWRRVKVELGNEP
jgi:hypothetical protein